LHNDEEVIRPAVVVPGIGLAVRPLVAEEPHIQIRIHLLQDLRCNVPTAAQRSSFAGQIRRSWSSRGKTPGQFLTLNLQLPPRDMVR